LNYTRVCNFSPGLSESRWAGADIKKILTLKQAPGKTCVPVNRQGIGIGEITRECDKPLGPAHPSANWAFYRDPSRFDQGLPGYDI